MTNTLSTCVDVRQVVREENTQPQGAIWVHTVLQAVSLGWMLHCVSCRWWSESSLQRVCGSEIDYTEEEKRELTWKSKSPGVSRNSTHRDAICKNKMNLNINIYVSRLTGNDHHRHGLDNEWVWSQIRQNTSNWNSLGTKCRGHLFQPC